MLICYAEMHVILLVEVSWKTRYQCMQITVDFITERENILNEGRRSIFFCFFFFFFFFFCRCCSLIWDNGCLLVKLQNRLFLFDQARLFCTHVAHSYGSLNREHFEEICKPSVCLSFRSLNFPDVKASVRGNAHQLVNIRTCFEIPHFEY